MACCGGIGTSAVTGIQRGEPVRQTRALLLIEPEAKRHRDFQLGVRPELSPLVMYGPKCARSALPCQLPRESGGNDGHLTLSIGVG